MLTALFLSENGVDTRIIDQHSRTAGHSYACALHPRSLELLDKAGLADDAIKNGHRVDSIGFYRGAERLAQLNLGQLPVKYPFLVVLEQSAFEDMLEQKLRRFGNVKVNWNHRLSGLEPTDDVVVATIEKLAHSGRGYSVPEFEWSVDKELIESAEYVVGTDGQNSRVRRCLSIPHHATGSPELYTVFQTKIDGDAGHEVKIVLDEGVASVMWPLNEGDCRWSFQLAEPQPAQDFPEKDRARVIIAESPSPDDSQSRMRRFLDKRAPWFREQITEVEWTTNIQFDHRVVSRFGEGRCWLAGDAAHQTGPVGMQSMNVGLSEAADLAERLRKIIREKASPDILKSYDTDHRAEWNQLLGLDCGPASAGDAASWAVSQAPFLLRALPASGKELSALLKNLGLSLK